MKNFIVLQNIVTFRTDWRNIRNPEEYNLFLILGPAGKQNLSAVQRACFSEVIEVPDFEFETLSSACKQLFGKHPDCAPEDFRILTNDEYYLGTAAKLREKHRIAGACYETVLPFTNKLMMKERMRNAGIPLPKVVAFEPEKYAQQGNGYIDEVVGYCGLPIFAKPIDSAGSEGTCFINDAEELRNWCEDNKSQHNYELDQYISGSLFHVDSIVVEGQIKEVKTCAYSYPNAEFLNGLPLGSITLPVNSAMDVRLKDFNQKVLSAMRNIPDGATHLEVFLTRDDELVFLEIAARAPGGMVPQMYAASCGKNIEEQHFWAQMEMLPTSRKLQQKFAAWIWFPQVEGQIVNRKEDINLTSSFNLSWQLENGSIMQAPRSIRDRFADILLWDTDEANVRKDFHWLINNFEAF